MTVVPDLRTLAQSALRALREGRYREARDALIAVAGGGSPDASVFIALAMAHQGLGDADGALAVVERALALEPRSVRALLLKGDLLELTGEARAAVRFRRSAVRLAQASGGPADLGADIARAQAAVDASATTYEAHLTRALFASGYDPARSSRRFVQALDLMTGRSRIYVQEPRFFYFPGLPQISFYDREVFPWTGALEAAFPAIRAELDAVLAAASDFTPYVERHADRPDTDGRGMTGNAEWSAFHLVKNGVPVAANAGRCPATIAAVQAAPLYRIAGRTPNVLFSRLTPGAHIPPHNGFINTRLICHLPLVVPDGCALRVGAETREWREGELLVFDDTVEHEAWNRGAADRTVLIFDVPRPEMTDEEHALVAALFQAVDAYGDSPEWSA